MGIYEGRNDQLFASRQHFVLSFASGELRRSLCHNGSDGLSINCVHQFGIHRESSEEKIFSIFRLYLLLCFIYALFYCTLFPVPFSFFQSHYIHRDDGAWLDGEEKNEMKIQLLQLNKQSGGGR